MQLHLLAALQSTDTYRQALATLHALRASDGVVGRFPALALDVPEAARPYLLAALQADWDGPVLIVTGSPGSARTLAEQVQSYASAPERVRYFHAPDTIFYDRTPWDRETIQARVSVLSELAALRREPAQGSQSADRRLYLVADGQAPHPAGALARRTAPRTGPGRHHVRPDRAAGARRL